MRIKHFEANPSVLPNPKFAPDKPICFICGKEADLVLDRLRESIQGSSDRNVYTLDAYPYGNDIIYSDSERRINSFKSFLEIAKSDTERGDKRPLFVYGFFDRIDEAVDITPFLVVLASLGRQVFVAVCLDYSVEKIKSEMVQIFAARGNNVAN